MFKKITKERFWKKFILRKNMKTNLSLLAKEESNVIYSYFLQSTECALRKKKFLLL